MIIVLKLNPCFVLLEESKYLSIYLQFGTERCSQYWNITVSSCMRTKSKNK